MSHYETVVQNAAIRASGMDEEDLARHLLFSGNKGETLSVHDGGFNVSATKEEYDNKTKGKKVKSK